MKIKFCISFLFFVMCNICLYAQAQVQMIDQAIIASAVRISKDLPANTTAAIIDFKSASSELNNYIVNELHGAVLRHRRIVPVTPSQSQIQNISPEMRFNTDGVLTDESAKTIGRLIGVRYLITGTIESLAGYHRLIFNVVDTANTDNRYQYYAPVDLRNDIRLTLLISDLRNLFSDTQSNQPAVTKVERVPTVTTEPFVFEMVDIPAGSFIRGSYTITLSAFKMGKYEVTQEQYHEVMGTNPSRFSSNPAAGETQSKRPVERVTWFDAIEFCNKLSEREELTPVYTITGRTPATGYPITAATVTATWTNNGYRLPTEAQWEYACRAGTTTDWTFGNDQNQLTNYAWYSANAYSRTHQVGKKTANAWGLYDMYGNVWEWCWDWYGGYESGNTNNPVGPSSGSYRVLRGGGWSNSDENTCSAYRSINYPGGSGSPIGFRVVRP